MCTLAPAEDSEMENEKPMKHFCAWSLLYRKTEVVLGMAGELLTLERSPAVRTVILNLHRERLPAAQDRCGRCLSACVSVV